MDEKRLEEIKARHKAVRCDGWPVPNGGLEAHADRGWLLEVIAEAQVAEKAAHPLRVVQARPCIGPWVGSGVVLTRYDAHGLRVGEASENVHTGAWGGWANVAFGAVVVVKPSTREEVTRAVDAVLATWADLDGVPATDALTQARTLLRRVRLRLGGHPKDGNAASVAHDVQMVDEIDAFLAGLPPVPRATEEDVKRGAPPGWCCASWARGGGHEPTCSRPMSPRTWTEEQIWEALERASGRRDIDADEPLTLSSRGMWKALREVGS